MQITQMLNVEKVSPKSKKSTFKRLLNQAVYTVGPGLLLLFVVFGAIYEWHYWKQLLWILLY